MSNNKELPTPRELGLEDDKGNIRKVEEAEERAYAEQLFRTILFDNKNNKDITLEEETVNELETQLEQAGEKAGQQWREEHIEELLRDYEERIKKIEAEQRIPDPEVARAMAEAEIPYLASASLKKISNADKEKLLQRGEKVAEKAFLISAPKRLEVLNKEIKLLKEQFNKIEQNYTEKVSTLSNPRWNVHTGAAWVESLYPEDFAIEMKEQSGIKSVSDREIGKEFNLTQANQISALKYVYSNAHHFQENIKTNRKELAA